MDVVVAMEVDAQPAALWAALSDPRAWPVWTDSIDSVEMLDPRLGPGRRVRIAQPRMRPLVWTVSEFVPGQAFSWTASAGGVTTTATHVIDELDAGRRSRLVLGLTQRGALAPVAGLCSGGGCVATSSLRPWV